MLLLKNKLQTLCPLRAERSPNMLLRQKTKALPKLPSPCPSRPLHAPPPASPTVQVAAPAPDDAILRWHAPPPAPQATTFAAAPCMAQPSTTTNNNANLAKRGHVGRSSKHCSRREHSISIITLLHAASLCCRERVDSNFIYLKQISHSVSLCQITILQ